MAEGRKNRFFYDLCQNIFTAKTRRKSSIFSFKVRKLEEVSHNFFDASNVEAGRSSLRSASQAEYFRHRVARVEQLRVT